MVSRFVKLKPFLIELLAKEEWSKKVSTKLREADWDLMTKVVSVLQVMQ